MAAAASVLLAGAAQAKDITVGLSWKAMDNQLPVKWAGISADPKASGRARPLESPLSG